MNVFNNTNSKENTSNSRAAKLYISLYVLYPLQAVPIKHTIQHQEIRKEIHHFMD